MNRTDKVLILLVLVSLFVLAGCATLTEDEKWERQFAREAKAEYKQWCIDVDGILVTDRFSRSQCVSREQFRDMMGGWQ